MDFGTVLGEACGTFALTNIDDIFVLVTFFAEASGPASILTPLRITAGQYLGFTVLIVVSMIGYGLALVVPPEPIGFLGLLPVLLGFWTLCDVLRNMLEARTAGGGGGGGEGGGEQGGEQADRAREQLQEDEEGSEQHTTAGASVASPTTTKTTLKALFKVGSITVINGGDNISLYIPLFAQLRGAEIAVYLAVYYVLLGLWCLAAWLVLKQRHVVSLAQRYVEYIVPFLYMGLGVYVMVKSDCYPWSVEQINESAAVLRDRGSEGIMAGATTAVLIASLGVMAWVKWPRRNGGEGATTAGTETEEVIGREQVGSGSVGGGERGEEGVELGQMSRA